MSRPVVHLTLVDDEQISQARRVRSEGTGFQSGAELQVEIDQRWTRCVVVRIEFGAVRVRRVAIGPAERSF